MNEIPEPRIRRLGLSEVVPPSAIDDEREEEPSSPVAAPQSYLNSFGQSSLSDDELAEEPQFFSSLEEVEQPIAPVDDEKEEQPVPQEDEKEEEQEERKRVLEQEERKRVLGEEIEKMEEGLEKIDSGLFEGVRLSINSLYQDIVDEYGEEDGTIRRLLEDDAATEFGYGGDDDQFFEAYIDIDVLYVGDTPLGLYKGRVFRLENTEDLRNGIESMEEYADYENPADSFKKGVDIGQYYGEDYEEDRRHMLNDSVGKVRWVQDYVLRNAPNDLLRQIIQRTKFFDAFIDKDMVRESLSKRTGRGKMKGGKFFLSDLLDMIMGKRHLEY